MNNLAPPRPFESWLDYAVEAMDTRSLFLERRAGSHLYWPLEVQGDDMEESAKAELEYLRRKAEQAILSDEVVEDQIAMREEDT